MVTADLYKKQLATLASSGTVNIQSVRARWCANRQLLDQLIHWLSAFCRHPGDHHTVISVHQHAYEPPVSRTHETVATLRVKKALLVSRIDLETSSELL